MLASYYTAINSFESSTSLQTQRVRHLDSTAAATSSGVDDLDMVCVLTDVWCIEDNLGIHPADGSWHFLLLDFFLEELQIAEKEIVENDGDSFNFSSFLLFSDLENLNIHFLVNIQIGTVEQSL